MKFCLTLDDFAPHVKTGLNFESIVWCDKLIAKYPELKINLFVPAAYCRLGEKPCLLSSHINWVEKVKQLSENNYRINLHGFYHRREGTKYPDSNNNEFEHLSGKWCEYTINEMTKTFDDVGLKYHKTFRPPGWYISKEAAEILTNRGFIIAGNEVYYKQMRGIKGLRWVNYTWDCINEYVGSGDVVAFAHTSNWTNNYMNEQRYNLIDAVLSKNNYEFKFIEELV